MFSFSRSTCPAILKQKQELPLAAIFVGEWDEMKKIYRGPYIDAFCQAWFHLVQLFKRSRLKYEKLMDENRTYGKIAHFW
jgi:hypothetical protein